MHDDDTDIDDALRRLLIESQRIVVLGASARQDRAAFTVPAYLVRHGYQVVPVNPRYVGSELHHHTVVGSLTEVRGAVDIVDVFRRSEDVPEHVEEILAMRPQPRAVWLQLGIRNDEAAERLLEHGIEIVQDRCMKREHARLIAIEPEREAR